jgi:bacterioferritin
MTSLDRTKSIEMLNKAVSEELTAVHQYMYFHFHCEDMGYMPLAQVFHKISIVEMMHVEKFAERILYLKGDVKMTMAHPIAYITDVEKMLKCADEMELETIKHYNEYAAICGEYGDLASKKLFSEIIAVEEDHQDIYDTEAENLHQMGETYLALQAIEHTKEAAE